MKRGWIGLSLLAMLGAAACGDLTSATLGYLPPADQQQPSFSWSPVPGAADYRVEVTLDRVDGPGESHEEPFVDATEAAAELGGDNVVGRSGVVTTTSLDATNLAWQPGHPVVDRPYFWHMLAYDGQGGVLATGASQQVTFHQEPLGLTIAIPGSIAPTTTPSPSVSSSPAAVSPSP